MINLKLFIGSKCGYCSFQQTMIYQCIRKINSVNVKLIIAWCGGGRDLKRNLKMADGDLPGGDGSTGLENGLQRDLSVDKELQDRIFQELETLNTEATRINGLEKGLHVGLLNDQIPNFMINLL